MGFKAVSFQPVVIGARVSGREACLEAIYAPGSGDVRINAIGQISPLILWEEGVRSSNHHVSRFG